MTIAIIKVNRELSYLLQKVAFSHGVYWAVVGKKVSFLAAPYLCINTTLEDSKLLGYRFVGPNNNDPAICSVEDFVKILTS